MGLPKKKSLAKKSGMQIQIKRAGESDTRDIAEFVHKLFPNARAELENTHIFFAAKQGRELVGFAHLKIVENTIYLQGIGVAPEFRKKGIGTRLLENALAECGKKYPEMPVCLKVKPENTDAIRLYAKVGFCLQKACAGAYLLKKMTPN